MPGVPRPHSAKLENPLSEAARELRQRSTTAEECLWQVLRNRQFHGKKFRRQHTIERFIVDFYCAEGQLVIELDGPIHDGLKHEDAIRQKGLEELGLHIIRFTNEDVLEHLDQVLATILAETGCSESE